MLSRRSFLLSSTAAGAVVLAWPPIAASAAQTADRIWTGGPILTMNDAAMRAEAVAEAGGRIIAVGPAAEVMKLKGDGTQVIDLAGRTLIPGFVDAHGHVMMGGIQALSANLLPPPDGPVNDIAALQAALKDWWEANRAEVEKVNLILGFGYDNSQLKELRHPNRDDLDAVSKDIPIVVVHQSGHIGVLNSKALELVGYTATTPDPDGGVIQRRPGSQEPNGVLEETAFFVTLKPVLSSIGLAGMKAFVKAGAALWARYGYTTAQEGRAVPATAAVLRQVADEGGLPVDVVIYADVLVNRDWIKQNASREYRNRLRVGGAKLTIDGSPQGFTAWRDRPYYAPVGNYPPGYSGYPAASSKDVIDAVDWAFTNNVQILTHTNGEAAGDLLIAAIRAATEKHGGSDRRAVLVHGQFQREDQADAYKELNVFPSLFPMHTFYWGDWHREHTVGPVNADDISPTGWYMQRGMKFSSHHDAPVAFPDSIRVLAATVTRRSRSNDIIGPRHRVPPMEALKAMTLWPAYSWFEETQKGSLETGKLADLVILSADPTAVDPETIDQIKVLETIKEGKTVFSLDDEQQKKGDLMYPGGRIEGSFSDLLRQAAVDREFHALPKARQTRINRKVIANAQHNNGCVYPVMAELQAAMLDGVPD
jgi:predicted amidohydrolase YtcJ